jgi:hypothetical protein
MMRPLRFEQRTPHGIGERFSPNIVDGDRPAQRRQLAKP